MEAKEEPPLTNVVEGSVEVNTTDDILINSEVLEETEVCHTSNGVPEAELAGLKNEHDTIVVETTESDDIRDLVSKFEEDYYDTVTAGTEAEFSEVSSADDNPVCNNVLETEAISSEIHEAESTEAENVDGNTVREIYEESVVEESVVEVDGIVDNSSHITFETEIFIESSTAEIENEMNTENCDEPDSSNILSELGQNIEMSEVLRSSDVPETTENNNCEQEVFNKEELLDILEGNDVEQSRKVISEKFHADSKKLEEHLAMQQLNRLKGSGSDTRKRNRHSPKKPEKKQPKRNSSQNATKEAKLKVDETNIQNVLKEAKGKVITTNVSQNVTKETKGKGIETGNLQNIASEVNDKIIETSTPQNIPKEVKGKVNETNSSLNVPKAAKAKTDDKPKKDSIVTALVQDWSDDETMEPDESTTVVVVRETLEKSTEELEKSQESVVQEEDIHNESQGDESQANIADTSVIDEPMPNNKSCHDAQPQRRLGRVIKKKVIFDPDNPDTFTKVHIKKEKDAASDKEPVQSTPKKIKADQSAQTHKTKSPISKMQWKKPQPKNTKQSSRRLTEIDKLLMDEGAVNMICQLTPEARMGNKNMKSKAEFIKNIQSNTPDSKEMKFRERKSKLKSEEGDPKKLGSAKHRLSLSSSVKSPAVSEDFENHSADDSIIYRRHSSSSYSSSCMSPRRLSDAEGGFSQNTSQTSSQQDVPPVEKNRNSSVFMAEKTSTPKRDIMNKSDCLSIKEKLNSKLSQALNKRKLPGCKIEKPAKVKKVIPVPVEEVSTDVTVNFDQKLAEICIRKAGSLFSIQIMKVLENMLTLVDCNSEVTVTLITSECGTVCSGLDLKPILEDTKHALDIANHARSLMRTLEKHSKLILVGVEGKSQGFSLALAALSDVLLASENASFALSEHPNAVLHPGASVLNSRGLPQNMMTDLIVFGREFSATEALHCGLVSRVIWPEGFQEQVRAIARNIAAQPYENIMLKKQMLNLKKTGPVSSFRACLEKERDLLVNYWTSAEGMELLRVGLDTA